MKKIYLILFLLNYGFLNSQTINQPTKVLIYVFEGVQIIDFTAPYETFGQAGYNIYTVSYNTDTIRTQMGLKITPDYDFKNSPDADVIVIPGGRIPHNMSPTDEAIIWLKEKEKNAKFIFTVCNGAFILGSSGYSDGLEVTTNAGMISHLGAYLKGVIPVYDKRFVHSGKFISAGGLTAGFDAALYIISVLNTKGRAQEVANKMEYNWDPENKYVRSKLADFHFSKILDVNPPLRKKVIEYEGNENRWQLEFDVKREESLQDFAKQFENIFAENNWLLERTGTDDNIKFKGKFKDRFNESWDIESEFKRTETTGIYNMKIKINKIN